MPYEIGDASPDEYAIQPVRSTPGQPENLRSQPSPKQAFDTYWRQASRIPAGPSPGGGRVGGGSWAPKPLSNLSSSDFDALQLSAYGPDTVKGGLSAPNLASALDPSRYSVFTPAPPLAAGTKAPPTKPGQLTLDLIHPFTSFAQATGPYINPNAVDPTFGAGSMFGRSTSGIDPMKFLAQRNIDILGNAPSRALDYLFAPLNVALNHLVGQGQKPDVNGAGLVRFAFQKDPMYWQWIQGANDEMFGRQAFAVAQSYSPGWQNQELQDQLIKQFQSDKNVMLGLSSGDEAIDYRAKQALAERIRAMESGHLPDYVTVVGQIEHFGSVFAPSIPVIGTQLGKLLDPVKPETEREWLKLTPQERGQLLQFAGMQQMVGSMIVTLPVFSGLGAVTAFGARAAQASTLGLNVGTAYKFYSTGMDVLTKMMMVGTGMALTNWAAEIASPQYADSLGREFDASHPVSDSSIGGYVNLLGYFASPVEVLGPYARLAVKPVSMALGRGLKAIPLYKFGLGGPGMAADIAKFHSGPELTAQNFATDAQALTLSSMQRLVRDGERDRWIEAIAKEDPTGNFPADVLTREGRIAHAQEDLNVLPARLGNMVTKWVEIIEASKRPLGAFATAADRRAHQALGHMRQAIEDKAAFSFVTKYGTRFWSQTLERHGLPVESVEGYRGWLQAQADRMGWQFNGEGYARVFRGNLDRWQTLARVMYHREYAHQNGLVRAAAEGSEEASRVMLARQTHLFRGDAVELFALINGRPAAEGVAAVAPDLAAARTAAWSAIQRTEELGEWWAKEKPGKAGAKGIEDVDLKALAKHLDALAPMLMAKRELPQPGNPRITDPLNLLHAQLEQAGSWTLGFKPQYARAAEDGLHPHDAAGGLEPTFVAYTHIGEGEFLQSPYLDYPMESADLIKLGGEGFVASKIDDVTRAFRSWRIGQFQEASLYRLATRYDGVTGAQAGAFFRKVQELAAEKPFGPKSSGIRLSPQGAAAAFEDEVQKIGEAIFGNQEMRNLDTGRMERPQWDEIAQRGFAQSRRLNLTAGFTARMKALPNGIGDQAIMVSDVYVPLLRFGMSPLFRIGEFVESKQLNVMRMGLGGRDPLTTPMFVRGGIGRQRGMMRGELSADPMAGGLMGSLVTDTKTSAASFLTPRRGSRPAPIEAANAATPPPGIDMPGGAEQMRDPAEVRYEEAQAALQQAEYELAQHTLDEGADTVMQLRAPDRIVGSGHELDYLENLSPGFARPQAEAWAAYDAAQRELLAARAQLPAGEYLRLVEQAQTARANLRSTERAAESEIVWRSREAAGALDGLKALADQLPEHAPSQPGFHRMYHGTAERFEAFDRAKSDRENLYGPGQYLTENAPEIAASYATGRAAERGGEGVVLGANVADDLRLLDLERPMPDDAIEAIRLAAERERRVLLDYIDEMRAHAAEYESAHPRPKKKAAAAQYDKELAEMRAEADVFEAYVRRQPNLDAGIEDVPTSPPDWAQRMVDHWEPLEHAWAMAQAPTNFGKDVWDAVRRLANKTDPGDTLLGEVFDKLNRAIEGAGYHGMSHEGGNYAGRGKVIHRVEIIFDPANAKVVEFNDPLAVRTESTTLAAIERAKAWHADNLEQVDAAKAKLNDPALQARYDEAITAADRAAAELADQARAAGPPPATELADMAGQPERVEALIDDAIAGGDALGPPVPPRRRRGLDALWNKGKEIWSPQGMKEVATNDLSVYLFRTEIFPAAMNAAGGEAVRILRELKVPERSWADFLLEDRVRLDEVRATGGAPHAWERLFAHAEKFRNAAPEQTVAELDAMYASPEWGTVSSLWLLAEQAARDEAYGVHFFSKYRSFGARSINHPLLGVYPAAWAYKVAKEWFKFLYDNHAFGEGTLRLGMAPAVAIANIEDSQNRLLAITGSSMEDVLGYGSVLGSGMFMFNLILPGDWSGLPFPFSRSIRMILRGNFNPYDHLAENLVGTRAGGGLGFPRDLRLFSETAGQVADLFGTVRSPGEVDFSKIGQVIASDGLPPRPKAWNQIGS